MSDLKNALMAFRAGEDPSSLGKSPTSKKSQDFDFPDSLPQELPTEFDSPELRPTLAKKGRQLEEFRVRFAAKERGLDPDLAAAVAFQESGFNPDAVSPTGVRGTMQLTRKTGKGLGFDRDIPEQNIRGGVELLARSIENNPDNLEAALSAYPDPKDAPKWIPAVLSHAQRSRDARGTNTNQTASPPSLAQALADFRGEQAPTPQVAGDVQATQDALGDAAQRLQSGETVSSEELQALQQLATDQGLDIDLNQMATAAQGSIPEQNADGSFTSIDAAERALETGDAQQQRFAKDFLTRAGGESLTDALQTGAALGANTLSFGLGDNLKTGTDAILASLNLIDDPTDSVIREEPATIAERVQAFAEQNQEALETLAARNPKAAIAGQLGAITNLSGAGPGLVKGAGALKNALNLARAGVVEGSAIQLGRGGGFGVDTGKAAGMDAALSLLIPAAGAAIGKTGLRLTDTVLGQKGATEAIVRNVGKKALKSTKAFQKHIGDFFNTTKTQLDDILTKNSDKVINLPPNTTPGDFTELADFFLRNEDLNTATLVEGIANRTKQSGVLGLADADNLQRLYGGLARTDAGVRGTIKATVYEARRKFMRDSIEEALPETTKKTYNLLKKDRQIIGGAVKRLAKDDKKVPKQLIGAIEGMAAVASGGATIPISVGRRVANTLPGGRALAEIGEKIQDPRLRQIFNTLIAGEVVQPVSGN